MSLQKGATFYCTANREMVKRKKNVFSLEEVSSKVMNKFQAYLEEIMQRCFFLTRFASFFENSTLVVIKENEEKSVKGPKCKLLNFDKCLPIQRALSNGKNCVGHILYTAVATLFHTYPIYFFTPSHIHSFFFSPFF